MMGDFTLDASQVIVGAFVLIGAIIAEIVRRRGNFETAKNQEAANELGERVQGYEEIDRSNTRLRAELEDQRRYRTEDAERALSELRRERELTEQQRIVAQHERDRGTVLGQQLHSATETILILKRAVRDEAMKTAADIAIQAMVQDADQTMNDADENNL